MVMAMHSPIAAKYQFPIRGGNQFTLLVDGDVFFQAMLDSIDSAREFILLEQYLVSSGKITDRFIAQLCRAVQRNVAVYVLLDGFGSSGLALTDQMRLTDAGVRLCLYNPVRFKHFFHNLFRNHRKGLIIDGHTAYIGGAGLADDFSHEVAGPLAWHDVMLEIQGRVVQDWCELFSRAWDHHASSPINLPSASTPAIDGQQRGRVLSSGPLVRQEINRALIKHLRRSRQRVWLTSPYFVATRKIRRLLRQAARRGLDVRLLLPGQFSDHPWISFAARRHYMRLLRSGVRIFEYQPRFIHAKIELCDDWVSIGSSNLDRWNLYWNLDANQAVYNADFARQVEALFCQDFADSVEISLQSWQRRPLFTHLREAISGLVIFWLERLVRFYR